MSTPDPTYMEQSACQHCGDEIDLVDGEWLSDSDDVCGTDDLWRSHQPAAPASASPSGDTGHPARTMLGEILAIVNRHQGNARSANQAMQEIEDAISTSMDALAIRAASPSGDTGQERSATAEPFPAERCPSGQAETPTGQEDRDA